MTKSQFLMKAIDIIGNKPQNQLTFPGVTRVDNIAYSREGGLSTRGDVYYDKRFMSDTHRYPVMLNIHGGGFVMGDKKYRRSISEFWADKGFFVFNINYRMPPEKPYPACITDCIDALNYLKELEKEYPLDLSKTVVTGDSSGGYSAAYLAALKFSDGLAKKIGAPKIEVPIAACMPFCGIYDIELLMHTKIPFGMTQDIGSMLFDFKINKDLSNIHDYKLIDSIAPSEFINESWCPVFLAWADDDLICVGQGEPMYNKLRETVKSVGCYHAKGIVNNHCYHLITNMKASRECLAAAVAFLKENGILED